jgi:hypothetical protein
MNTANCLQNRMSTKTVNTTPCEKWHRSKSHITTLQLDYAGFWWWCITLRIIGFSSFWYTGWWTKFKTTVILTTSQCFSIACILIPKEQKQRLNKITLKRILLNKERNQKYTDILR